MKIKKYKVSDEKTILTALIVHDGVLSKVFQQIAGKEREPFKSKWSNLVSKWCFDFYSKYNKAPRADIKNLFVKWSQTAPDENQVEIVESFLATLSDEYEVVAKEMNEKYVVDLAGHYFEKLRLERLAEEITLAIEKNDLEEARALQASYESIDFSDQSWSNPFDSEQVHETLKHSEENRTLIHFPGDLGRFLNPHLVRGGFISFAGPEKRGKSYWLGEIVWRALKQGKRVLYYVLGDMSREEVNLRLYTRALLRPEKTMPVSLPLSIKPIPAKAGDEIKVPQPKVEFEEKELDGLNAGAIRKAAKRLAGVTASKELRLKLLVAGGDVISASKIEKDVENFAKEGWIADVVVIDYGDLLDTEPSARKLDYRHQVNSTWKILRRIPLRFHCLLVTATQAAARSYNAWIITKKDFSEDKRKNAHVTGLLGINQTAAEKKLGVYRLNWIVLRNGKWSENQVCWTAGNLELSCPCLKSSL